MATNQGFKSLVPRSTDIDVRYLYHWLRAHKSMLQSLGNGATFKELSRTTVERIEIALPDVRTQRRIASSLDGADDALRVEREILLQLDRLEKSVFSAIFGDPLDETTELEVRPLREWVDPGRPITYGILKPGPDTPGGVAYVRVADMKDRGIAIEQLRRTSLEIASNYRRSSLRAGDLLMSIRGHVGRFAIAPSELEGANITQDSARLSISEPASTVYVRAAMETASAQDWLGRRTRGAAVRGINLGDLRLFPLPVPSQESLEKHAATVAAIEAQRTTTLRAIDLCLELRGSIRQNAFSGAPS